MPAADPPDWSAPPAFAGRRAEIKQLTGALVAAEGGEPRVVVIVGDAGFGKSRIIDEFLSRLDRPRTFEVGSAASPVDDRAFYAVENLARRALRDPWFAQLPSSARLRRTIDGWRAGRERPDADLSGDLLEALHAAAQRRPTIVTFDDAHWADRATLNFLYELASAGLEERRRGRRFQLLTVIAHRSIGPDHPAATALDWLRRPRPYATSVLLDPLDELSVHELLRHLLERAVPPAELQAVIDATRGVPLLVEEAARQIDRGRPGTIGDGFDPRTLIDAASAADSRLGELTAGDLGVLRTATFLPMEFDDDTLARLVAGPVEATIRRAGAARVLIRTGGRLRFAHPMLVERLLDGVTAAERAAEHLRLATTTLQLGDNLSAAHHLVAGGAPMTDASVRGVIVPAAAHAFQRGDYRSAGRLAQAALDGLHGDDHPEAAALLVTAGTSLLRDHDPHRAITLVDRAIAAADRHHDGSIQAQAWVTRLRASQSLVEQSIASALGAGEFVRNSVVTDDLDFVMLLEALAEGYGLAGADEQAVEFADRAELVATRAAQASNAAGHEELASIQLWAALARGFADFGALRATKALRSFERAQEFADATEHPVYSLIPLVRRPMTLLLTGDLVAATAAGAAATAAATRRDWAEAALASSTETVIALARGDLDAVEEHGARALSLYHRTEYGWGIALVYPAVAIARALGGHRAAAHEVIDDWAQLGAGEQRALRALVDIRAGFASDYLLDPTRRWRRPVSVMTLGVMAATGEVAAAQGAGDVADSVRAPLDHLVSTGVRYAWTAALGLERIAGEVEASLGGDQRADQLLRSAIVNADRCSAGVEQVLGRLSLARLHRADDQPTARRELDQALAIAEEHGMRSLAREADRVADSMDHRLLRRPTHAAPIAAGRPAAFMMTDIVNSTGMNANLGDEEWVYHQTRHDDLLRGFVVSHGGHEVAHTGDGLSTWFERADDALSCARSIQRALATGEIGPSSGFAIRIGIVWGTPVWLGKDAAGLVMARTQRVMSLAQAGEIALDEAAVVALTVTDADFDIERDVVLRGFDGPQTIARLRTEKVVSRAVPPPP